jgi:hypothetical protein
MNDPAIWVYFMEDEHYTAVEIGKWAIEAPKEVHLALDSHSSSYNQIGIKHIIWYCVIPP